MAIRRVQQPGVGCEIPKADGSLRVGLCYTDCHNRGGVERVLMQAARHLSRTCEVSVVSRSFPPHGELPDSVGRERIRGIRLPLGLDLPWTRMCTAKVADAKRWDVCAGFGVQAPEGSVVWVQSVHAAWWEEARLRRRGWRRWVQGMNPFHRIVLQMEASLFGLRRYRRLVALTKGVQADLARFYGVPASDVEVVPNGFSADEFHAGLRQQHRRALRKGLGIEERDWVVLFVANEWERKGLMPLLEAVAGLGDSRVHVVAVGDLPGAFLAGHAQKMGLSGRVHLVGPTGGVGRWFGMADVFAMPTVYEAWGMVIIEALAAGLPVLTSRCAGAAEAVREAFSGYLLGNPSDAAEIRVGLARLREGVRGTREEIADSVSEYEWEKVLGRYEKILRGSV